MTKKMSIGVLACLLPLAGAGLLAGKVVDSPPCTSEDKDAYRRVALELIYPRVSRFSRSSATRETVVAQTALLDQIRQEVPGRVPDACLSSQVYSWLDYYEKEARSALSENALRAESYAYYVRARQAEERHTQQLKDKLGVAPF